MFLTLLDYVAPFVIFTGVLAFVVKLCRELYDFWNEKLTKKQREYVRRKFELYIIGTLVFCGLFVSIAEEYFFIRLSIVIGFSIVFFLSAILFADWYLYYSPPVAKDDPPTPPPKPEPEQPKSQPDPPPKAHKTPPDGVFLGKHE